MWRNDGSRYFGRVLKSVELSRPCHQEERQQHLPGQQLQLWTQPAVALNTFSHTSNPSAKRANLRSNFQIQEEISWGKNLLKKIHSTGFNRRFSSNESKNCFSKQLNLLLSLQTIEPNIFQSHFSRFGRPKCGTEYRGRL